MQSILIADDHPLFCEAMEVAVMRAAPDARVLRASTLAQALTLLEKALPSAVFLDLMMPDSSGFTGLAIITGTYPELPVIMVSASEEPSVLYRAHTFGARGFVPKSSPLAVIQQAISAALRGDTWWPQGLPKAPSGPAVGDAAVLERLASLTPGQMRVLMGLADGLLNKQIAYEMQISEATIKAHITAVFRKLNVLNRTQAVIALKTMAVDTPQPDDPAGKS